MIEISFALFLLNILKACGKFAIAIKLPKIVAKTDNVVIFIIDYLYLLKKNSPGRIRTSVNGFHPANSFESGPKATIPGL